MHSFQPMPIPVPGTSEGDIILLWVFIVTGSHYVPVGDVIDENEEVTDLETLLRLERQREKTQHQEDMDEEVCSFN